MKVALLGDIAFIGKFSLLNNPELYGYFEKAAELLRGFDLVVGNLETPFVPIGAKPYGAKSAHIGTDEINVELLKFLNIGAVNLANNHIFDYGSKAFEYTKNILKVNNIEYFGVDGKQIEFEHDNNKLSFSGYCCYSANPLGTGAGGGKGINELDYPVVEKNIDDAADRGFIPIISIHCGEEHINYPNPAHVRLARKLSYVAPYVFYGHHPHVLQGIENFDGSLLAYSLGNFCFDDVYRGNELLIRQEQNNREAAILELIVDKGRIYDYKIIPIFMGNDCLEIGDNTIVSKMMEYSARLGNFDEKYTSFRNDLLNIYLSNRKRTRNIVWYLRRMNIKSARMILAARKNAKMYARKLTDHL